MFSEQGTKRKTKTILPKPNLVEATKENLSLPTASVNLLMKYFDGKMICEQTDNAASGTSSAGCEDLSTDDILKMAREILLQCNTQTLDVVSILVSDFFNANSGIPSEKSEDFELALLLQAAAFKVSNQQFDRARKLLNMCQNSTSSSGSALHRIVSYFSVALQERIARETGEQFVPDAQEGKTPRKLTVEEALTTMKTQVIESQHELPFCQVTEFTAIQAIVENVASARRVHLVDLGIGTGLHLPIMMQALVERHECPIELLKISAIGPSKEQIEEVGKMLSSFAGSMNIPFEFKVVVSDLKDLKEDLFELSDDEALAIYSELRMARLLHLPDHLVSLLRTIEKLNPCVMVVTEIEARTDSPIFLDRFDAALSVCAAVFQCLDDIMDRESLCRAVLEGVFVWEGIQNVITTEGEERVIRHERLDFWRAFLTRFGFLEVALSDFALCQLDMVVKRNPRWSSCTTEVDGKGLIIGWKGTPIKSLSVWKFQHE